MCSVRNALSYAASARARAIEGHNRSRVPTSGLRDCAGVAAVASVRSNVGRSFTTV